MKQVILLHIFYFLFFTSNAQNEDSVFIRRLADEILTNSKAYDNLRVLTKQIGGRLAGSPQMVKAEQWGLKAMEQAGADKAWLQECMVPHWVRGGKDKAYVLYSASKIQGKKASARKELDVIALGNSIGSMKPLTASVILIKDFEDLERKKIQ